MPSWSQHQNHHSNKIHLTKSLYINFLVDKSTFGVDHDILNSRSNKEKLMKRIESEIQSIRSSIKPNDNFDVATFEYKNDITGLKMLHKINVLESTENQDVFQWVIAFKEISKLCNWNDAAQLDVLKHIINVGILYETGIPTDPKAHLKTLLKLKYNPETAYKYSEYLSNIKQEDYITIIKYASEIESYCKKLGLCLDWSDNLIEQKVQEVFFNGLHPYTKLELSKYAKTDYRSVYNSIVSTENIIIETLQKQRIPISKNANKNENKENRYQQSKFANRDKNKKYCSYHRTRSHSDDECRANKKYNKENNDNKTEKQLMSLQEPIPTSKTITI
ncbi:hypothetical protein EQH57_0236, partial [Dictyocoela roeselum]